MKHWAFYCCFLVVSVRAFSQSTFKGYVTIQNSGKGLYPAIIRSSGATDSPTESRTGFFELVFDTKDPGDDIVLQLINVGKLTYEIVPPKSVNSRIPRLPEKEERIHLVVCIAGSWENKYAKWKEDYKNSIRLNTDAKIADLKKIYSEDQSRYRAELYKLTAQRDSAIKIATKYAELMAQTDLSTVSKRFKKAFDLFINKHIDEAIKTLNEDQIQADINKENEIISESTEARDKLIDEFMIKARAYIQLLNFSSASRLYDRALKNDTANYGRSLEAAAFYKSNNENLKAIIVYKRIAKFAPTGADSVMVMGLLAQAYAEHNKNSEAESIYKKNLIYYRVAVQNDSDRFSEPLAMTLTNLGLIANRRKDYLGSGNYLVESIHIYERLLAKNPAYIFPLVNALNNLGNALYENQAYNLAAKMFLEGYNTNRKIFDRDTTSLDAAEAVAASLSNLAITYEKINQDTRADSAYRESIQIYRSLTIKRPYRNLHNLSQAIGNYASFNYNKLKDTLKAFGLIREAISKDRQLAANDLQAFEPLLANHFNSLALFFNRLNIPSRRDSTNKYFNLSLAIRRKFVNIDTLNFGGDYAASLINIAMSINKEQYQQAILYDKEAIRMYLTLVRKEPNFLPDIGKGFTYLGMIYWDHKDYKNALATIKKSVIVFEPEAKIKSEIYLPNVLLGLNALIALDEEMMNETADTTYLGDGKKQIVKMMNYLDTLKNDALKKQYLPSAIDSRNYFINVDKETINWMPPIYKAQVLTDSIMTTLDKSKRSEWQNQLGKIINIALQKKEDNKNVRDRLLTAYHNIAWYALFAKRPDLAQRAVEKGLALIPNDEAIMANLALSYLYQGKWKDAQKIYLNYKNKNTALGLPWNSLFLNDLNDLEHAGITTRDAAKVRILLAN